MAQHSTIVKDPAIETDVFTRDAMNALSERSNEPAWMMVYPVAIDPAGPSLTVPSLAMDLATGANG